MRKVFWLSGAALFASCFAYFLIPDSVVDPELPEAFIGLSGVYTLQFILYFFALWALYRSRETVTFWEILFIGLACRGVMLYTAPVLENDYWRYMWDGRVFANGINPFTYLPGDSALDHLNVYYRKLIGWTEYRTIYPPVAQYVFKWIHLVFPDSLLGLKFSLSLFDIATGCVLAKWMVYRGIPIFWSALYFFNPLVFKEIPNSAHLDSIPVFFCVLAVFLMDYSRKRNGLALAAWGALSLAIGAKLYSLVLIPLFARVDRAWKWRVPCLFVTLGLFYIPFLSAGPQLFHGTGAYTKYWVFNASIFQLVNRFYGWLFREFFYRPESEFWQNFITQDFPAKFTIGIFFLLAAGTIAWRLRSRADLPRAVFWVLAWVLMLSPVVDAWYVLWVLPFACLVGNVPWLVFSYLVLGGYAWFYSHEQAYLFRIVEYSIFYSLLLYDWRRRPGYSITGWGSKRTA